MDTPGVRKLTWVTNIRVIRKISVGEIFTGVQRLDRGTGCRNERGVTLWMLGDDGIERLLVPPCLSIRRFVVRVTLRIGYTFTLGHGRSR